MAPRFVTDQGQTRRCTDPQLGEICRIGEPAQRLVEAWGWRICDDAIDGAIELTQLQEQPIGDCLTVIDMRLPEAGKPLSNRLRPDWTVHR